MTHINNPTNLCQDRIKQNPIVALSLTLFLTACQAPPQPTNTDTSTDESIRFSLLHTNDHHGRFWPNRHGEYGMAARKTLVDEIRQQVSANDGFTLLLSGGDINTGVPESDLHQAEPDIIGMNLMGYDAMAVGNHEFDNSFEVIRKQQSWAQFPFLAANIYDDENNRPFEPYKLFQFKHVKIAVVGLITHTTASIANKKHIRGLNFTLPEKEASTLINELKKKVDVVIALTHMGHNHIDEGTDVVLARTVEGIDVIVGGHSSEVVCVDENNNTQKSYQPTQICHPANVNNTWIMQAEKWGKYLGRADFIIDDQGISLESYQLIPVNLKTSNKDQRTWAGDYIEPDAQLERTLLPFQQHGQEALQRVVTITDQTLSRNQKGDTLSPLGRLISQSYLNATNADIAIANAGGIRDNLYAGTVTRRDLLQVMPFANTIVTIELNGKALINYLNAIKLIPNNPNRFQYSGFRVLAPQNTIQLSQSSEFLDEEKIYRVALNNFMAAGGDHTPDMSNHPSYLDSGILVVDAVETALSRYQKISAENFLK